MSAEVSCVYSVLFLQGNPQPADCFATSTYTVTVESHQLHPATFRGLERRDGDRVKQPFAGNVTAPSKGYQLPE